MNRVLVKNDQDPKSPHRGILDRIPSGEYNAISEADLARGFGEERRQIRHRIQIARMDGNIIAGTDAGYFIPETVEELRAYVNRTVSRIQTSQATVDPAILLLEELDDE